MSVSICRRTSFFSSLMFLKDERFALKKICKSWRKVNLTNKWNLALSEPTTHAHIVLLFYQLKCILFAALKYFMSLFYYSYLSFNIYAHFKCIFFDKINRKETLYQNSGRNAENPWKAELNRFLLNYYCSVLNSPPFFHHRIFIECLVN